MEVGNIEEAIGQIVSNDYTFEDRMMLEALLYVLEDQEREIVTLHALTGLKHREIAKLLELKREDVVFALDAILEPVSLYEPIYSDSGDTVCVMDQVKDCKNTDELWLERIALKEAVSHLTPREQKILSMRFYQSKTQMEVSAEVGITQAQVSRLEKGAINTIKKNI